MAYNYPYDYPPQQTDNLGVLIFLAIVMVISFVLWVRGKS